NTQGDNTFTLNGDGYSNTTFASTSHSAYITLGTTFYNNTAVVNGKQGTITLSMDGVGVGSYRITGADLNMLLLLVANGSSQIQYQAQSGTINVTESTPGGTFKGNFTASLLRADTGAQLTI